MWVGDINQVQMPSGQTDGQPGDPVYLVPNQNGVLRMSLVQGSSEGICGFLRSDNGGSGRRYDVHFDIVRAASTLAFNIAPSLRLPVPNQLDGLPQVTPAGNDRMLIEDESDSFAKKRITIAALQALIASGINPTTLTRLTTGSTLSQAQLEALNGQTVILDNTTDDQVITLSAEPSIPWVARFHNIDGHSAGRNWSFATESGVDFNGDAFIYGGELLEVRYHPDVGAFRTTLLQGRESFWATLQDGQVSSGQTRDVDIRNSLPTDVTITNIFGRTRDGVGDVQLRAELPQGGIVNIGTPLRITSTGASLPLSAFASRGSRLFFEYTGAGGANSRLISVEIEYLKGY